MQVIVQAGAGLAAGFSDEEYVKKGATIVESPAGFHTADIVTAVRQRVAERESGEELLHSLHAGQAVIAMVRSLGSASTILKWADRGITFVSRWN